MRAIRSRSDAFAWARSPSTIVLGDKEYAISAHGRAGGLMKALVDGEGSFSTHGIITDNYPVPTKFSSKIVSNAETSDVIMVLEEGSVKELAASPPPGSSRVPVTEANRQGIVDPLTAMLFSAATEGDALSPQACRRTLPIFDGQQRYDLKFAFKRRDKVTAEKGYASPVVGCWLRYEPIAGHNASTTLVRSFRRSRNGDRACTGCRYATASAVPDVGREHAGKLGDQGQPVRSDRAGIRFSRC